MPWLIYCGLRAGLSMGEVLISRPGEIQDLSACYLIDRGAAEQKVRMSFDETLGIE